MTLLLATITPRFALLSQDTAVAAAALAEPALLNRDAVTQAGFSLDALPGPVGGEVAPIAHHRAKMQTIPGLAVAIGGIGCMRTHLRWLERLVCAGVTSLSHIAALAPALLAEAWQHGAASEAGGYLAVVVGWCDAAGGPLGFAFASGEGFAPRRMEPASGHALHPGPATDDAATYPWVERLWVAAAHGDGTLAFHRAYAANAAAAYAAGRYPPGMVIGGFLETLCVTSEGVSEMWGALPGPVPATLETPCGPIAVTLGEDEHLAFPRAPVVRFRDPDVTAEALKEALRAFAATAGTAPA